MKPFSFFFVGPDLFYFPRCRTLPDSPAGYLASRKIKQIRPNTLIRNTEKNRTDPAQFLETILVFFCWAGSVLFSQMPDFAGQSGRKFTDPTGSGSETLRKTEQIRPNFLKPFQFFFVGPDLFYFPRCRTLPDSPAVNSASRKIKQIRSNSTLYQERGCGFLYVTDGLWKLSYTHCLMESSSPRLKVIHICILCIFVPMILL